MLPVFVHQEKGGLFGGFLKKTPRATGDDTEVRLWVPTPGQSLNSTRCLFALCTYQVKDSDKEITASNDSLSEGHPAKVSWGTVEVFWNSAALKNKAQNWQLNKLTSMVLKGHCSWNQKS